LATKNLLRNRWHLASFQNLRGAHAINKHTGKHGSSRVNDAHLRSLRNHLLIACVFLGNIFWRLDAEWLSQRISP
jgi:hypothetical protein